MEVPFWNPNLNDIATDISILKIVFIYQSYTTSLRQ